MEQKDQEGNKEYQFIREKVVSKRKSRIKKMLLSFGFTIFLAVVFGVVARAVFLCADGPVRRLLGLENEPNTTPTARPTPTKSPVRPGTTPGTQKPGADVGQHSTPPLKTPTPEVENSLTGEPTSFFPGTATPVPTPGEGESAVPTPGKPSITPGVPVTGEPSASVCPTGAEEITPTVNPNGEPGNPEDGDAAPTSTPSFAEQYCNLFAGMQEVAKR